LDDFGQLSSDRPLAKAASVVVPDADTRRCRIDAYKDGAKAGPQQVRKRPKALAHPVLGDAMTRV
jgi:hypothetical protein